MKITYYGHSCFVLESGGWRVCLDPFKGVKGYADPHIGADELFCSHDHFDHNCAEAVELSGRDPAESPFDVTEVPCWHDDVHGAKRGPNIIRVFEAEGLSIAHFGDIGCELSPEQKAVLSDLDVALVPVGGTYTLTAAQSKALMDELQPKVAIGVGGSLDVWSGSLKRAPQFYIDHGLEWLYRMIQEPKRIKRTASIPAFLIKVMKSSKR